MYSKEELKELIEAGATVNININIDSSAENGQQEPPPIEPETPDTKLVQAKFKTVLYGEHPGYPDAKNPVMQGTGIVVPVETIYQVFTPAIMAVDGEMVYKIYSGENNDDSHRGLFIKKEKVKNY